MIINMLHCKEVVSDNLFQKNRWDVKNRYTKLLFFSIAFGLSVSDAYSAGNQCIWKGPLFKKGKWTDALNWKNCGGGIPKCPDDVIFRAGIQGAELDKDFCINSFEFKGGSLCGTNNLRVKGVFNWTQGNISEGGIVDAEGGLELNRGRKVMKDEQALINRKKANWTDGSITLFGASSLVNESGGVFNVTKGGLRMSGSSNSQFFNAEGGKILINLNNSSKNVQFDNVQFNNDGALLVKQGISRLGGGGTSAGSFEVVNDGLLNFSGGTHTLLPNSSVIGTDVEFSHKDSGGRTTIGGAYNVKNTVISGNAVFFSSADTSLTETLVQTGGYLDGVGNIDVTGQTTLSGGIIQSSRPDSQSQAQLVALGGLDINGNFIQIVGNRRVINARVANWTSGGIRLHSTLTRFENALGAIFNIRGEASFIVGAGRNIGADPTVPTTKGLFVNHGDVVVDLSDDRRRGGPVQINTIFANLGNIDLQGDKLAFGDALLQFSSGALLFDISGLTDGQFDVLNIAGNATLDGIIAITLTNGFVPQSGDTFNLIVAKAILPFQTVDGVRLGGVDGHRFDYQIVTLPLDPQAPLEPAKQALQLIFR